MLELTERAESLERRELLARCPGTLRWARVRELARYGSLELARAGYVSLKIEGALSPFAGKVSPSRGSGVTPRIPTAIYWGNRRYPPKLARRYWSELFS